MQGSLSKRAGAYSLYVTAWVRKQKQSRCALICYRKTLDNTEGIKYNCIV